MAIENLRVIGDVLYERRSDGQLYPVRRVAGAGDYADGPAAPPLAEDPSAPGYRRAASMPAAPDTFWDKAGDMLFPGAFRPEPEDKRSDFAGSMSDPYFQNAYGLLSNAGHIPQEDLVPYVPELYQKANRYIADMGMAGLNGIAGLSFGGVGLLGDAAVDLGAGQMAGPMVSDLAGMLETSGIMPEGRMLSAMVGQGAVPRLVDGISDAPGVIADTARSAGRTFVERMNQPGPVPVMYSNPIPGLLGHNGGPKMPPGIETMGLPAGSLPEYRGAAPNRTTEYPRYEPTKPTDRMARLIGSTEDPAHPIHSTFDSYIDKGQTLGGSDWYNSEELRNWFIDQYGDGAGDTLWRDYIDTVGATSTGSDVPSNMRNASFYFVLPPGQRRAVAERVSLGGITPLDAAKELGIDVPNAPDNYRYGHVMQGNHAKNILAQLDGRWTETPPPGLTKGERSDWLKANPKVKGFRNDLLGSEANIAADKHFMRILAMSDGGTDFLSAQAGLSGANLEKLRATYGDAIEPYINTRKTGTGQMVTEANLYKAAQDGVLKDTSLFKDVPTAWLDVPNANEYSSLETMAQRLSAPRGMTPAQFQANLWMGAGDVTGLADESQGTFMDLFRRTLDKRARERGTDRLGQFTDFAARNAPLMVPLGVGGAATALGGGLLSRDPREQY